MILLHFDGVLHLLPLLLLLWSNAFIHPHLECNLFKFLVYMNLSTVSSLSLYIYPSIYLSYIFALTLLQQEIMVEVKSKN